MSTPLSIGINEILNGIKEIHLDTKDEPVAGTGKVAAILVPKGDGSKEHRPLEIKFEAPSDIQKPSAPDSKN
ncbi:MAG: hypothetical protein SOV43_07900 [Selenomonadaceae bacterium]|nr:hypothetical protein [Selenomonadaceae bacterium]